MPPAIVDVVVEAHGAPLPDVDHDLPWGELHGQLHFPFLGQDREEESAVDAMERQAEDQGKVGRAVAGRDDAAQRHLDASPRGEDDPRLEGDDAIRDGPSAGG